MVLDTLEILIEALPDDAEAALERLERAMDEAGASSVSLDGMLASLGGTMAGSLMSASSEAAEAGSRLAETFASSARSGTGDAKAAGGSLSAGFAQGIRSGSGAAAAAAEAVAQAAVARLRRALDIHSPSKVAESLGAYFTEGFAEGIETSLSRAESAVQSLAGTAVMEMELPQAKAESAVAVAGETRDAPAELTVPLYIDGMKLAEACIRGINRVTRSAGRVMLEL